MKGFLLNGFVDGVSIRVTLRPRACRDSGMCSPQNVNPAGVGKVQGSGHDTAEGFRVWAAEMGRLSCHMWEF